MSEQQTALAPTSAKLTTQYLVLDHMTNHYSKITKAKSAIDNKPPKTMSTSQKARDRKTRDHVKKTGHRPTSAMNTRRPHTATGYYQDDLYDENLWGDVDPEDEEEMLIHNIMRTTLRANNDNNATHNLYGSDPNNNQPVNSHMRQRPSSARSHLSVASGVSRTMVQIQTRKNPNDGDLLEKRSHVFTEEKPFTPRTLKTDRKSALSQYKYYNKLPPKEKKSTHQQQQQQQQQQRQHQELKLQLDQTVEQPQNGTLEGSEARPQPRPRPSKRLDQTREGPVTMNSLMFETLHSRDFSQFQDKNGGQNSDVPKLDISMDTDHLKWIKEQASKAQVREGTDTMKSTLHEEDQYDTTVDFGKTGEMSLTYGTLGSTKTRPPLAGGSQRRTEEDTEAGYVRFMNDITTEVLNRGIYTDRALRQVFKSHITRNRGKLDELRMNQITDEIRKELNIPRYDIDDDTSFTMTKDAEQTYADIDDTLPNKYSRVKGQSDTEVMMNGSGTMEMSLKSRASKASTEWSHDSYNFKSTEDEELYSTIRSNMGNTLSDMQALKTYQDSIKEQEIDEDEVEEREVVKPHHSENRGLPNGHVHEEVNEGNFEEHDQGQGSVKVQRPSSPTIREDSVKDEKEDDTYDDNDYDDDYEDDGDDEDTEDVQQTTERTATYRTDDDDF